jgi:signal peptidase II
MSLGRYGYALAVVAAIVLLDQVTKALVMRSFVLHESMPIIPSFFSLTYVRNPGAAFGLLAQQPAGFRTIFFILVSIVALVLLGSMYAGAPAGARLLRGGLVLVMAGAVGNFIDRLRFGEVIDFLDFYVRDWHWPAFNVADSCITIGVGLLLLHYFVEKPSPSADSDADTQRNPAL